MFKVVVEQVVALVVVGSLLASFAVTANSAKFFINGYSDNYTPSVPVVDFFGSWKGAKSYEQADKAYSNQFFQVGVQTKAFSIAAFYRYDYNLTMHPDVAEYRYTFHNARDELQDKDYVYDFFEQRLTTQGVRVGYFHRFNNGLSVKSYLNVFTSSKYQQRDIRDGYVNGISRLGDANANYFFSKDSLYQFLEVDKAPKGYGASLDFELTYTLNSYQLTAKVKDLGHVVKWDASPYAIGSFRVNHFIYNQNDVREQAPLASLNTHEGGIEKSFSMHLPIRASLGLQKTFEAGYRTKIEYFYNEIFNHAVTSVAYDVWEDLEIEASVNLRSAALGLKAHYKSFYVKLISDNVNPGYANSLSLYSGLEVPL